MEGEKHTWPTIIKVSFVIVLDKNGFFIQKVIYL